MEMREIEPLSFQSTHYYANPTARNRTLLFPDIVRSISYYAIVGTVATVLVSVYSAHYCELAMCQGGTFIL